MSLFQITHAYEMEKQDKSNWAIGRCYRKFWNKSCVSFFFWTAPIEPLVEEKYFLALAVGRRLHTQSKVMTRERLFRIQVHMQVSKQKLTQLMDYYWDCWIDRGLRYIHTVRPKWCCRPLTANEQNWKKTIRQSISVQCSVLKSF